MKTFRFVHIGQELNKYLVKSHDAGLTFKFYKRPPCCFPHLASGEGSPVWQTSQVDSQNKRDFLVDFSRTISMYFLLIFTKTIYQHFFFFFLICCTTKFFLLSTPSSSRFYLINFLRYFSHLGLF